MIVKILDNKSSNFKTNTKLTQKWEIWIFSAHTWNLAWLCPCGAHENTAQLCHSKDFRGPQISMPVTTRDVWNPDSSGCKHVTLKALLLVVSRAISDISI